jgi:vacuolar-type H+-ATPase subunit E/Vma4
MSSNVTLKIGEEILAEAKEEAKKKIEEAKKRSKELAEKAKAEAEKAAKAAWIKTEEDAKLIEEKKLSEARREASLKILSEKNSLIKNTFQEALKRLKDLAKKDDYYTYLCRMIESSVTQLGSNEVTLRLNQRDLKAQNKILEGLKLPKNLKLTVDKEPIETMGGYFISTPDNRIKINGTFEYRLSYAENLFRKEISGILFGD